MKKRLLALVTAFGLVLGGAAVLPEGAVSSDSIISASAETYGDYEYWNLDDGTVEIFRYNGNDAKITIPSTIDGKKVSSIGDYAFYGCTNLTSITIPNSVTSIGYSAFNECTSLTSITIPNSVTSITIPNSDTGIGWCAFKGCTSLTSITIPNSVTSIGKYAFEYCESLTSITIPDSVTNIGDSAFYGCTSLTSITIPNSITSIGNGAFYNTPWLDAQREKNPLVIVNNILIDGKTCKGKVTIPNSVTSIGHCAFEYCENLTSITIPNSVTSIGNCAFDECESLTSITIPNSVTSIGGCAFRGCENLTSITIPNSVTSIGDYAFYGCKGLIIKCHKDSQAQAYVIQNSIPYELIDDTSSGLSHTHSYTSRITKSATCTQIGTRTYTCTCGDSYSEVIPMTAHKYTSKVVKPTYDAQGYTLHTCSVCGDSYKDTYTAKLTRTSIAKAAVSGLSNKTYTGKAITQKPVVKLNSKTLKAGTDYTVSYKNNKAVGTATVTITGKGAYTGSAKATFKITPKKTTLKSAKSPKSKKLKVAYSKVSGVTGYQVTYSTSKKFTKATTKSVYVKGTSKTISKLKKGKTYYVKVRTYKTVKGTKYYSGYSAVKKVSVK